MDNIRINNTKQRSKKTTGFLYDNINDSKNTVHQRKRLNSRKFY